MIHQTLRRCTTALALAALVFTAATVIGAPRASAQCTTLTVRNSTTCTLPLCFFFVGGGSSCVFITPGLHSIGVPTGSTPGVTSVCGNNYLMQPLPSCVTGLLLLTTCCVDVCFNPGACTVSFAPGTPPCHC